MTPSQAVYLRYRIEIAQETQRGYIEALCDFAVAMPHPLPCWMCPLPPATAEGQRIPYRG